MSSKAKYCIQWESHSKQSFKGLCSLMEHQSLVDIVICCGNNTTHAHKCVLAANSPLFREELEKNLAIEQVIVSGCDFVVMKSIIEIMYCGETIISEEYIKYLAAAAKTFQMKGLESLFLERNQYQFSGDDVFIPRPQFLSKKPKYPTAYHPFSNSTPLVIPNNPPKQHNYNIPDPFNQRRLKRRYVRSEAEKACAKEAQASRMALANLQKEIASAPQVNSFIIEESCTETTVENFIPHSDDRIQMVDYNDLNPIYIPSTQYLSDAKPNLIQFSLNNATSNPPTLTTDKIKHILGQEVPSNVEIMFKTSEGKFVSVTDEVLQNISKGGLQYQVVDENGHVGEIQELHLLGDRGKQDAANSIFNMSNPQALLDPNSILDDHKIELNNFVKDSVEGFPFSSNCFTNSQFTIHGNDYEDTKNIVNELEEKASHMINLSSPNFISTSEVTSSTDLTVGEPDNQLYKIDDNLFISNLVTTEKPNKNDKTEAKSPKKFSPDMFFADLPENHDETEKEEFIN